MIASSRPRTCIYVGISLIFFPGLQCDLTFTVNHLFLKCQHSFHMHTLNEMNSWKTKSCQVRVHGYTSWFISIFLLTDIQEHYQIQQILGRTQWRCKKWSLNQNLKTKNVVWGRSMWSLELSSTTVKIYLMWLRQICCICLLASFLLSVCIIYRKIVDCWV